MNKLDEFIDSVDTIRFEMQKPSREMIRSMVSGFKIELPFFDRIERLVDSNPGAATVICRLTENDKDAPIYLNFLESFRLTGPTVWIIFKEFFNSDMDLMKGSIRKRLKACGAISDEN